MSSLLYKAIFGIFPECSPPSPVYADTNWLKKEVGKGLCAHCKFINRKKIISPLNIMLENGPEEGVPCAVVESTGIMLWHRGFLEIILDYLQDYAVGDCYLADGTKLFDYKTCYSAEYIFERGNKQSKYIKCPDCGITTSSVRPGPVFISEKDLSSKNIYQDAQCKFYLTEKVASLFDFKNWEVIEDYYSHYLYFETIGIKS